MARGVTTQETKKANTFLKKTKDTKKRKTTRKPRFDQARPMHKHLSIIETSAAMGLTHSVIAYECGISRDTFRRWVNEYEDVSSALERGIARRRRRAIVCTFHQAFPIDENGRPTGKGNPALMQFWLKCREGFMEKTEQVALGKGKAEDSATPVINYNLREPVMDPDDVDEC